AIHRHCALFFFQAEDGIRDGHVTGVQTCALPIFPESLGSVSAAGVTKIPIVLLEKSELATAVWTGETGHAIRRSPAVSNKAFSSIPKNEILSPDSDSKPAKMLLAALPIGTSRHHSSVGRAAAL